MPGSDILGSKGQSIVEVASGGLGVPGTPAGGVMTVQSVKVFIPLQGSNNPASVNLVTLPAVAGKQPFWVALLLRVGVQPSHLSQP